MLTVKQQQLLSYIKQHLDQGGVSPSFEEMKEALDLKSKSGIHRLISALEERGFIRRLPNRARALEILKLPDGMPVAEQPAMAQASASMASESNVTPLRKAQTPSMPARAMPIAANDVIEIPLHGRIAAGLPIEAMESDTMLPVPAALLGSGDHYALEVSGDSMIEAGIFDGDYALIQRTETARDGQIVVALIDDSEATLKYFHRDGRKVRLDPANRDHEPQTYEAQQVRIQGRLAGLLRRYN
ncbi:MAG: transcriptional repressor LexA [Alphaproteobacteria bacterium]|nr:transcriptional repressor LexA [Alphaproteobacteria bacterium]MBU0792683.1 transcriptional repressor LexA [Alphaproteobacteria bacterium]MBU0877312.1 transcriptional repressor LexA [Alphaproteobacteria bacterium]MBU1770513.1 transcriptional repressor LexA [Alphaproteobacteria bacterium]